MDELFSVIIRLLVFAVIIRGLFRKSKKSVKTGFLSQVSEYDSKKKKQNMKNNNNFFGIPFDENSILAKAIEEQRKAKNEISIKPKQNMPKEISRSTYSEPVYTEIKPKQAYERVKVKNKKSINSLKNNKRNNNFINKKSIRKDVVRGIIFKEILSEPRSKKPYQPKNRFINN